MKKVVMYRVELVRERSKMYDIDTIIDSQTKAVRVLRDVLGIEKWHNEKFGMMCLDAGGKLIGIHIVSEGTLSETAVYVREVAVRALLNNAANVIIFHNHPAETLNPSLPDMQVTKNIKEGLKTLNISLHDHLILTIEGYTSFAEKGLL